MEISSPFSGKLEFKIFFLLFFDRKGADLTKADQTGNTVLHDLTYQMVQDPTNRDQHLEVRTDAPQGHM